MKLVVVGNCQAEVIADLLRHMKPDWQIARARVLPSDLPRLQAGSGHLAGLSADGVMISTLVPASDAQVLSVRPSSAAATLKRE